MDGSADAIVNMTLEERCVVLSKTVVSRLGHFLIVDSGEGGLGFVANQGAQVGCCLLMLLSLLSLSSPYIVIFYFNHNSPFHHTHTSFACTHKILSFSSNCSFTQHFTSSQRHAVEISEEQLERLNAAMEAHTTLLLNVNNDALILILPEDPIHINTNGIVADSGAS